MSKPVKSFNMFPKLQRKSAKSDSWSEMYFEEDRGLTGWIFASDVAITPNANETRRLEMPNGRFNRVREPSSKMGSFEETTGDRTEGRMGFKEKDQLRMDFGLEMESLDD